MVVRKERDDMKYLIYYLILRPLIKRNYRLRGLQKPQEKWYWADKIAYDWGYWTEAEEGIK